MTQQPLDFMTAYGQFYVTDSDGTDDIDWDEQTHADGLVVAPRLAAVRIATYGNVKGILTVLDKENDHFDASLYDHITEASITIDSGILQVRDCPYNDVMYEIVIPKGIYHIRVSISNLSSVIDGETGDDYYTIELWLGEPIETVVIKRHPSYRTV